MAKYLRAMWECQCGKVDTKQPWKCPGCGKEVCEWCFDYYMHCRECSAKHSDKSVLKRAAETMYMVDFDE